MNDKHEERIIKELQKRHDAGKERGDDRLFLDAIELIEQLTRTPRMVTADKADGTGEVTGWYLHRAFKHWIEVEIASPATPDQYGLSTGFTVEIDPASIKPASPKHDKWRIWALEHMQKLRNAICDHLCIPFDWHSGDDDLVAAPEKAKELIKKLRNPWEEVVATDGKEWRKMKMCGGRLSFSGSHSFDAAVTHYQPISLPSPAVGQAKITQRCIDRLKHVEKMLRGHHAGRKGILSIADGIKQTLNVAKADIQAASIKPASPKKITPENRCPCGGQLLGQGYSEDYVHFACSDCGAALKIPKDYWNKVTHPSLPEQEANHE